MCTLHITQQLCHIITSLALIGFLFSRIWPSSIQWEYHLSPAATCIQGSEVVGDWLEEVVDWCKLQFG